MSRVLITGGAGFIGSALCNRMAADGHDVRSFDNNSRHRGAGPEQDIRDDRGVSAACGPVSAVYHLAAINGTASFYSRPADVLDVQIRGTQNVIDACVRHDVKTLALFSSSEVYQTPPTVPTPESIPLSIPDITNPRYSYAIGKIAAEAMAWWSPIEKVWICRPHNVIGPNMGFDHVVPEMIRDMSRLSNGATYAIKNPMATRSFIYIDDFVDATMAIHESVTAREGKVRDIFHVGTEEMVTIEVLAKKIADTLGKEFVWTAADGAPGGTMSRCPDTAKVRALGWEPKVLLDEALRRTVAAYLEKREEWAA